MEMNETPLVKRDSPMMSAEDWKLFKSQLQFFIDSKLLPGHIRSVNQAAVIVKTGEELGLKPLTSLRTIYLVNGTPAITPKMMLALANEAKVLEDLKIEKGDEAVTVIVRRKGRSPHSETFGVKQATKMGLMGKDNYRKQPTTMFMWRAISMAMNVVFPDVLFGLYTPEELGATVTLNPNDDLDVTDVQDMNAPKPPPREELIAMVEAIDKLLASECGGDMAVMDSIIQEVTRYHDPKTGRDMSVHLNELHLLVDQRPHWIPAIIDKLKKREAQRIPPPPSDGVISHEELTDSFRSEAGMD